MFSFGRKEQYIILVLIGVIIFGVGVKFALAKNSPSKAKIVQKENIAEDKNKEKIFVHVSGAVQKPGLYDFTQGARVKDALDKAIPNDKADLEALNLAELLTDGLKLTVLVKGQAPASVPSTRTTPSSVKSASSKTVSSKTTADKKSPAPTLAPGEKVNINTADQSQLDKLPGVGPITAKKIIDYRNSKGGFKSVEEIKEVAGIGDKKFSDLVGYITI